MPAPTVNVTVTGGEANIAQLENTINLALAELYTQNMSGEDALNALIIAEQNARIAADTAEENARIAAITAEAATRAAAITAEQTARIEAEKLGSILRMSGATGTANTVTATVNSAQSHVEQVAGQPVQVFWPATNTGPATLNGFAVKRRDGSDLAAGDLLGGSRQYLVVHQIGPIVYRLISSVAISDINGLSAKFLELASDFQNTRYIQSIYEGNDWELGYNNLNLITGQIDLKNRVIWGFDPAGTHYNGPHVSFVTEHNNLDLIGGQIASPGGQVFWGATLSGGFWSAGVLSEPLGENNLDLVGPAVVDRQNRVIFGVTKSGDIIGKVSEPSIPTWIPYVVAGNIFVTSGTETIQITETGLDFAPVMVSQSRVRWLSTRRRGLVLAYEADVSSPEIVNVAYSTVKKYEGVANTGQSLMLGGDDAISTTAPYPNDAFCWTGGPIGANATVTSAPIKPLAETTRETISTGFVKQLFDNGPDRKILFSGQAYGGMTYDELKKGGSTGVYELLMTQIDRSAALDGGTAYYVLQIIHGEADGIISNTNYANDLVEWLDDYTTDIQISTGQRDSLIMLICQTSSAAGYKSLALRDEFVTPFLQLQASETDDRIYLLGPKYHLPYKDHSHLNSLSTAVWGEKFAQVYRHVAIEGKDWRPVSPENINAVGATLVIDMHVPVLPLVIDTTLIADPGNLGFNLLDAGGVTITDVSLTGANQVTVTFSAAPPPGARLSYAFHNGTHGNSGPTAGARGCIRDSDMTLSINNGLPMHNWLCAFQHNF